MRRDQTLLIIIGVVAALALAWIYIPRPMPPDCSFSSYERSAGVELSAQAGQLRTARAKLGLTEGQIADHDALLKDFAIKYDTACRDATATPPRMSQEEYACIRQNMNRTLDELRRLGEMARAIQSSGLSTAANAEANKILDAIVAAGKAEFRSGCSSALSADPKKLLFNGLTPERSLQLVNRGHNPFTFAIEDYPRGFEPQPPSGRLERGQAARVALFRTIEPVPATRPLSFQVRTSMSDSVQIEIELDAQNADLWSDLASRLQGAKTVEAALNVINSSEVSGTAASQGDRLVLASAVLTAAQEPVAATKALVEGARLGTGLRESAERVEINIGRSTAYGTSNNWRYASPRAQMRQTGVSVSTHAPACGNGAQNVNASDVVAKAGAATIDQYLETEGYRAPFGQGITPSLVSSIGNSASRDWLVNLVGLSRNKSSCETQCVIVPKERDPGLSVLACLSETGGDGLDCGPNGWMEGHWMGAENLTHAATSKAVVHCMTGKNWSHNRDRWFWVVATDVNPLNGQSLSKVYRD